MKLSLPLKLAIFLAATASASTAHAQMRFEGMDTNNDGVVTRDEWRGSARAFQNQDWNGDGVLSGDEVRPGAQRQRSWNQDLNRDGIVDNQDAMIGRRFNDYDTNNDGRVSVTEWSGNQRLFTQLDTNRDRYLSVTEYAQGGGYRGDNQGGPAYRFSNLDDNRDGWITRNEWNMGDSSFNRIDTNRDNRISRTEFENSPIDDNNYDNGNYSGRRSDNSAPFNNVDSNRDGWITRSEWRSGNNSFDRLDTNNDNRLSRFEFDNGEFNNTSSNSERTRAFENGFGRGLEDGRTAGREDRQNGHGWDLDGQTELERADAGYNAQYGSLSDYQAGYRDGFRQAYRDGFNNR